MSDVVVGDRRFPEPKTVEFLGLTQTHYISDLSEVVYTPVIQGKAIPTHQHLAAQIGMCAGGSYLMKWADSEETILPFGNACNVQPNILHGAPYPAAEAYLSLDIKRAAPERACYQEPGGFRSAGAEQQFGGLRARVVTAPWFRILYGTLAAGSALDLGGERPEVIGIPFGGRTQVRIDGSERECGERNVFFAPAGAALEVNNPNAEDARLVLALITV